MTTRKTNKFGVPYHCYQLHLADNTNRWVDVGDESDWGNIQQMNDDDGEVFTEGKVPDDWDKRVGWGNDCDGHIEINDVIDLETNEHLNPREWADCVWKFVDNYAA